MRTLKLMLVLPFVLAAGACDNDDDDNANGSPPPAATFDLQVLHASADAPAVNILLAGDEVLSDVDYKGGSERLTNETGTYSVQVDGLLPSGVTPVIGPVDVDFAADLIYSIIAIGKAGDGSLEPLILEQPRTAVSAGSARAFVVHAAPDAPEVDVYVTAPDADLASTAPLGTFAYQETLGPSEVAAGDYQVRVTPAGDSGTVVYDSGVIALGEGSDLLLAAVPSTTTGPAPISLVALDGTGSFELPDAGTPVKLRVVHASPDAPAVDVIANDTVTLVDALPFPQATGFL
jgi:hypothetical protein